MSVSMPAEDRAVTRPVPLADIRELIIAGWTGRDLEAMEHHAQELEAIGITRPKTMPTFYRVSSQLLTASDEIEVVGDRTSGEVEAVLFSTASGLWLGLGSDHTDRELETIGITVSKQICAKPVAAEVWPWASVADHWDQLLLRCWIIEDGARSLYQEGPVTTMRDPGELIGLYHGDGTNRLNEGEAMFCGTLAAKGGIRSGEAFELELEDPVTGRTLRHSYRVRPLPVED